MSIHIPAEPEVEPAHADVGVASLVRGILDDARRLLMEQLTLFQVEMVKDLKQAVTAIIPIVAGMVILLGAIFLLGSGAAHFLCWLFPELPLWAGFGIAGGAVVLLGITCIICGKVMLLRINPTDTALKGLKENIQWKTKN